MIVFNRPEKGARVLSPPKFSHAFANSVAKWHKMAQDGTRRRKTAQDGARWHKPAQDGASRRKTAQKFAKL
jgi:hypothetical protein